VRQMVRAALQRLHDEDPNLFQEVQKRVPMLRMAAATRLRKRCILGCAAGRNLMGTHLPAADRPHPASRRPAPWRPPQASAICTRKMAACPASRARACS
jgi:hypothetical protein